MYRSVHRHFSLVLDSYEQLLKELNVTKNRLIRLQKICEDVEDTVFKDPLWAGEARERCLRQLGKFDRTRKSYEGKLKKGPKEVQSIRREIVR